MATKSSEAGVISAGDVQIDEVVIIGVSGAEFDVREFVLELNIFEDMYSSGLKGFLMMTDAQNLAELVPFRNEEYIRIKVTTPSLTDTIYKTFRVFSITDRKMLGEPGVQTYIIHFCSAELFIDMMSPMYRSYEGKISDIVAQLYENHLMTSRNGKKEETPLIILPETENSIKYISPGWTPMQNIHWLATRSIGVELMNPGYLFYESNKCFYFANIEGLIIDSIQRKSLYARYIYMAQNVASNDLRSRSSVEGVEYKNDLNFAYSKVESMEVVEAFNGFKNANQGYYANRLFTVDTVRKDYAIYDYDHVANYNDYGHMENIIGKTNELCMPMVTQTLRAPASHNIFYPRATQLHDGISNNVGDVIERIIPRRISTMQELSNMKVILTVPGRTDAEIGNFIYFSYPNAKPKDRTAYVDDNDESAEDPIFSGVYMISAIRHKITLTKHMMILEIVKDSVHNPRGLAK